MGRRDLGSLLPGVKYGHRVMPDEMAGLIGLPYVGNIFYVDATAGSDNNPGTSQNDAFATVGTALGVMTANQHDVTILAPTGGTGRTSEATAITWNKRFTHLVGNAAPTPVNVRAGLTFATGGSLTISENGCIFKNLTLTSSADIDVTVAVTGNRNSFQGMDFKGTSNSTSADSTPWRALNLNGGEENYFGACTFGADTMSRGALNATLEMQGGAIRNTFEDCFFTMHADAVETQLHVLSTGSSGLDRYNTFKNTDFYAFYTNHTAKVNAVFDISAQAATADILMLGSCTAIGFDDWEATVSNFMWFPAPGYDTNPGTSAGIGINNVT